MSLDLNVQSFYVFSIFFALTIVIPCYIFCTVLGVEDYDLNYFIDIPVLILIWKSDCILYRSYTTLL